MFHADPGGLVAIFAIVGIIARSIVKVVMDADVRKIEARRAMQTQDNTASASEIEKLRAEIGQLRETTTQHALSLQHSVERLDHRVEFMEQKSIAAATEGISTALQPQVQQIAGHRR